MGPERGRYEHLPSFEWDGFNDVEIVFHGPILLKNRRKVGLAGGEPLDNSLNEGYAFLIYTCNLLHFVQGY